MKMLACQIHQDIWRNCKYLDARYCKYFDASDYLCEWSVLTWLMHLLFCVTDCNTASSATWILWFCAGTCNSTRPPSSAGAAFVSYTIHAASPDGRFHWRCSRSFIKSPRTSGCHGIGRKKSEGTGCATEAWLHAWLLPLVPIKWEGGGRGTRARTHPREYLPQAEWWKGHPLQARHSQTTIAPWLVLLWTSSICCRNVWLL